MVRTRTIVIAALLMVAAAVAFGFMRSTSVTGGPKAQPVAGVATGRPTMYEFSTDT